MNQTPPSQSDTRISFPQPMKAVSFHYALNTNAGMPNAYFYSAGGALLGTIPMTVCGANACGHPCTGDPNGMWCFHELIGYGNDAGIAYLEFSSDALVNWVMDDLSYYREWPSPGPVAIMGNPFDPAWSIDVANKLLAHPLFSKVDVYYLPDGVPPLDIMNEYCGILAYTDNQAYDEIAFGDRLADYVDDGGGVVAAMFSMAGAPSAIKGRFDDDNYWAIQPTGQQQGTTEFMGTVYVPSSPMVANVSSFSGGDMSFRPTVDSLHPDATLIAEWTGAGTVPLIATRTIDHTPRVDLGFYPPSSDARFDFWDASTDGDIILANALYWVCAGPILEDGFEDGHLGAWSRVQGAPQPATCGELYTTMPVWGSAAGGLDLRSRTQSTLHWLGCNGNGCSAASFYCADDPVAQTLAFGTIEGAALRTLVDPGNAIGDTIPSSSSGCCSVSAPNDVCNAPDSICNGEWIDCIDALCRVLGYRLGEIVREVASNSCPESHALDTTGVDWTSDYIGSSGYGAEYLCSGFMY
jgi:hypothetical protein